MLGSIVQVGQVVVETFTGRRRLRRAQARAIEWPWSYIEERVENLGIMDVHVDDAGDQLSFGKLPLASYYD